MTAIITILASHWRIAAVAALITMIGSLGLEVRHYRSEVAAAHAEASAAKAETATVRKDALDNQIALESTAADAANRAAADDQLLEKINASRPSVACAKSGAIRALLAGVRQSAVAGATSRSPNKPAHVSH